MPKRERSPVCGQDLAKAPSHVRCERVIERGGGVAERCSRFTIRLPDGDRDRYCVSHSTTEYAATLRSKGSKAQRAASEVERARLESIAHSLLPRRWRCPSEVLTARFRLYQAIARQDVSASQARELRAILIDVARDFCAYPML